MEYEETITKEQFYYHLEDIRDINISHVWLGYAASLFLECGRLKKASIKVKEKKENCLEGELTFMLDCNWRIESTRSIFCGRNFKEKTIETQLKKLVGLKIQDISIVNRIPELLISLENNWLIQTFTDYSKYPKWFIGFNNLHKIAIHPEWKMEDVSVWLSYEKGGYRRSFCFDDEAFRNKKFLNDYCK